MSKTQITTLHFTTDGRYHCDGLATLHPGMRAIRIGGGLQPGEVGCESCPRFAKCGMSHVSTLSAEVRDIAAVEALCKEKGWTFKRNQKTYEWWGHHVGDYPLPKGIKKQDLGKCDHAIGVPGTEWEIGLVKNKETGGYRLAYDFFGSRGQPILNAIGQDGGIFLQGYGVALAKLTARKQGYYGIVQTTLPNGTVRLEVQVGV